MTDQFYVPVWAKFPAARRMGMIIKWISKVCWINTAHSAFKRSTWVLITLFSHLFIYRYSLTSNLMQLWPRHIHPRALNCTQTHDNWQKGNTHSETNGLLCSCCFLFNNLTTVYSGSFGFHFWAQVNSNHVVHLSFTFSAVQLFVLYLNNQ